MSTMSIRKWGEMGFSNLTAKLEMHFKPQFTCLLFKQNQNAHHEKPPMMPVNIHELLAVCIF